MYIDKYKHITQISSFTLKCDIYYIAFEFKYEINRELRRKAQEPCEDKFSKTFK